MGEEESVLDALNPEDDFGNIGDVDMVDAEEGEIMEHNSYPGEGQSGAGDTGEGKNGKPKPNKKKRKKKRRAAPKAINIDRFVIDTCRRLKEKKSYMVYSAAGCLGVSALSDIVNEVEAIQACGGQTTADGSRNRTGGGVLWNVIKARQPAAYREIMKKTKEFEKQFRHPNSRQKSVQNKGSSSEGSACVSIDEGQVSDLGVEPATKQTESETEERKPLHERIRVPVSYDDLFGDEPLTAS